MDPKMFMGVVLSVFALLFFCGSMFFGYKFSKSNHSDTGFIAFLCGIACIALLAAASSSVGIKLLGN